MLNNHKFDTYCTLGDCRYWQLLFVKPFESPIWKEQTSPESFDIWRNCSLSFFAAAYSETLTQVHNLVLLLYCFYRGNIFVVLLLLQDVCVLIEEVDEHLYREISNLLREAFVINLKLTSRSKQFFTSSWVTTYLEFAERSSLNYKFSYTNKRWRSRRKQIRAWWNLLLCLALFGFLFLILHV